MARLKYSDIEGFSPTDINAWDEQQSKQMLEQFREKLMYRQRAFKRAGKNVYSPALEKINRYYEKFGEQSTETMSRDQAQRELFHIQEFFKSRTGSVKGAREVMREQDIRVFGESKRGNPRYRMSREERDKFWSVYEEFMRSRPRYDNAFMSGKIQQYLGEITLGDRKDTGSFKGGTIGLMTRLNELEKMIKERNPEYDKFGYNVLSGRRSNK